MKKSKLQRTFELAKMAAQIGLKEARSGDLQSRLEQAKIIAEGLSQLKGAAMKAGQLLSIEVGDYFPKEAQEILSILQNAAVPTATDEIKKTIERELGFQYVGQLQNFVDKPAASASIGQVHRAEFRGRAIALKVQYPGVAESIDSDLAILKKIARALCLLTGREMDLNPLFREFQEVLGREVNYLQEAENQKRYRELVQQISGRNGYYYFVPEVVRELSTEKLLAMSWEPGVTLKEWLNSKPSRADREHIAHALLNLYCYEFFEWGLVQTDPNFANYLVRHEGDQLQLGLLDFGAVREYEPNFVQQYTNLLRVASGGDDRALILAAIEFGLLDPRESEKGYQSFVSLMKVAMRPFFSATEAVSPRGIGFQFADEAYAKLSRQVVRDLTSELKFSPPPYKLIFLHRKLGGLFAVLKSLAVEIDVSEYWRRMIEPSSSRSLK